MGIWESENISSADELSTAVVAGLTDGGVTTLHKHDIVGDTTPQLGGDLDLNGNTIAGFTEDLDINGNYITGNQGLIDQQANCPGYYFDGVDDVITIADNADTNFGTDNFSLSFNVLFPEGAEFIDAKALYRCWNTTGVIIEFYDNTLRFKIADVTKTISITSLGIETNVNTILTLIRDDDDVYIYNNGNLKTTLANFSGRSASATSTVYIGYGNAAGRYMNMIMHRLPVFNLALDPTDPTDKAIINGGGIPYKYIGASQVSLVDDDCSVDNTDDWYKNGITLVFDTDHYVLTTEDTSSVFIQNTYGLNINKQTLSSIEIYIPSTNINVNQVNFRPGVYTESTTITVLDTWVSASITNVPDATPLYIIPQVNGVNSGITIGDEVWIRNIKSTQIGCVLDLNPESVGSNTWVDNSGNGLHGVVSGALPTGIPANHREKFIDLSVTGDTSFTLPAGYMIESIVIDSDGAIGGGIDIGTTNGGGEIVSAQAISGAGTVICTLVAGANYNTTGADDTIYITDADGTGWDSAIVGITVSMAKMEV